MRLIREVTIHFVRRRTIRWHQPGSPALCTLCGVDAELISVEAAARCAGVVPERLLSRLERHTEHVSRPVTRKSLVCLRCLSMTLAELQATNSTE
jgi:hypothetical protein